MTIAVAARATQTVLLAAVPPSPSGPGARVSQAAMLVSVAPPEAAIASTSQVVLLAATSAEGNVVAQTSQVVVLVAKQTGIADPSRSRAGTIVLDGHTFYVLDLGAQGTFLYDTGTKQWCKFETLGYGQWNMRNVWQWGDRVVGGDLLDDHVWEMQPTAVLDEGWRDIQHKSTGGLSTRSRTFLSCDAVRISASIGQLDEVNGATMTLEFSDDQGQTWSAPFAVDLISGDYGGEIAYRSLGSFMAPGRVFRLTDVGGLIRIDGADAFIDGFDDDAERGKGDG